MKITEAKLKQIILEEVIDRVINYEVQKFRLALREECARKGILLTEAQEDDVSREYERAKRTAWLKKVRNAALAGGVTMASLAPFAHEVEVEKPAQAQALKASNIEKATNKDSKMEKLEDRLSNKDDIGSWIWQAEDSMSREGGRYTFPTDPDNEQVALMPIEWSVGWDVLNDMENNAPAYPMPQELLQILAAQPEITPEMDARDIQKIQNSFTKEALSYYKSIGSTPTGDFFTVFTPDKYEDAGVHGVHGYISVSQGQPSATFTGADGSQQLQDIQYIPSSDVPDGYVMGNGLNKQQQYEKFKYVEYLPMEEFVQMKKNL